MEEDEVLTRQRCDQTEETRSPEQNTIQGRTGFLPLKHLNSSIIINPTTQGLFKYTQTRGRRTDKKQDAFFFLRH